MPTTSAIVAAPRLLVVERASLTIDDHALADVRLSGWAYGPEIGTAPAFVIVGGITASPFPFGGHDGRDAVDAWWPALSAPDLIDPTRHTVLCPSWPGNGSSWRGFEEDVEPSALSVAGLADLVAAWLDGCGCHEPVTFAGASLGGMVAVAFAVRYPERCAKVIAISAGLRPDGWGTATRHLQRELVRDGLRSGDVATGMSRARQMGMLTYRGRDELDTRFGKLVPGLKRPPVAEYLDYHGQRFAERFPVRTFLLLSEAIDRAAIGDDPHAIRAALSRVSAETIVVGVPGDMLFPWALQVELHRELQAAGAHSSLWKFDSVYGHDAFLADQERLADLLRGAGAFGDVPPQPRPKFEGVGIQPIRELRIGLIGCGVVGHGLLEMIDRQRDATRDRYGVRFRVSKIAVRNLEKPRGRLTDGIPFTDTPIELVSDPDVDVVVEVAGGRDVESCLRAALAAGKPVVTSNRTLLAAKLPELAVLAQRTETPLYCEAAAAAALPILRHLSHRADEVESLAGIVNCTCNYIITRFEQAELSFEEAMAEARALGFVEGDGSDDVSGVDAAEKLSILVYRAFGAWAPPDSFPVRGIGEIDAADCDLAEAMGCRIRLIARATRLEGGALEIAVEPLLLPSWHLLASVEEEYNAVYLRRASSGDLSLFGKGAGALPTATAVLGDLIDLAQDNSVQWPEPQPTVLAGATASALRPPRRHYLRVVGQAHPGLERRIETLVRNLGLMVQNRASRHSRDRVYLGFMISPAANDRMAALREAVERLGRVEQCLILGALE